MSDRHTRTHRAPVFRHAEDLRWTSDVAQLSRGAASEHAYLREKAVQNELLDEPTLRRLATEDESERVRAFSGFNPRLPGDLVSAKARGNVLERLVISQHPELTDDDAIMLASDASPEVVVRIALATGSARVASHLLGDRERIDDAFRQRSKGKQTLGGDSARVVLVSDTIARLERIVREG